MTEFKKGDKVRFVDTPVTHLKHQDYPEFYPEPGTIGTVYQDSDLDGTTLVEWPQAAFQGARSDWWALSTYLERVEDAAPVPNYYIRVTATSKDGAQVEVNGPAGWVHKALAQVIMKLNPSDPFGVLACVLNHALDGEEGNDDGTE